LLSFNVLAGSPDSLASAFGGLQTRWKTRNTALVRPACLPRPATWYRRASPG